MPAPEMLLVVKAIEASRPKPLPPKRPDRAGADASTSSSPTSSNRPSSSARSFSASGAGISTLPIGSPVPPAELRSWLFKDDPRRTSEVCRGCK